MQVTHNKPALYRLCGNLTSRYGAIINPELENAISESYKGESVFEIVSYRKHAISRLKHGSATLVSQQAVSHVQTKYLHFKKDHTDLVDGLLEKMGIAKHADFSVIHWRAEVKDIDYIGCARDIMRARDFMNQKDTPFVLMSSLNTNWDHMWGGARNEALNITNKNWNNMLSAETNKAMNSTSMAALKLLMDSGFLKLDSVIDASSLKDSGLLAVWDLIIATKAKAFATCTLGCGDVCSKCNYEGNFAKVALRLRKEAKKESMSCWPQN